VTPCTRRYAADQRAIDTSNERLSCPHKGIIIRPLTDIHRAGSGEKRQRIHFVLMARQKLSASN
jgi:hypothetical protein